MAMPKEVYLVWQDDEQEQFFNQYFSLTDAVSDNEEGTEIFRATLKSVGQFKLVTRVLKSKKKKKAA